MKLIPTIIQDVKTKEVYMLAYMNVKSMKLTKQSGYVHFWSRKRRKIWRKGETSGNALKVVSIIDDCDKDALLILVNLEGKAVCHTGSKTCFHNLTFAYDT